MFNYFISIAVLVLLMAGCSTKSHAQVKFENDKLMHDLYTLKNCRIESTKKLDDGVSSAEIIAAVVIQDCLKDSKYVMDNNMYDKSDSFREHFSTQMNDVNTSGVLGIILKHRSKKGNEESLKKSVDEMSNH